MAGFRIPREGVLLMPMAGVTDAVTRLIAGEMGADICVSEMLSAMGWVCSDGKNQKSRQLIRRLPGEGVCELQLFGKDPAIVSEAARRLEDAGYDAFDLNFGCPMPKITGNGEGSFLMRDPVLIGRIVSETVKAVKIPVTCKMRSGWDAEHINAPLVARVCEEAGAAAVTIHARTADQLYTGRADRNVIARVKEAVNIPVIGNGDIRTAEDAVQMLRETGCDAVGIGRGSQGDPWIFAECKAVLSGKPYKPPTASEKIGMALRHFDMAQDLYGERPGMLEMRKHIGWYIAGMKDHNRTRNTINTIQDPECVRDTLIRYREMLEEDAE